MKLNKKQIEEAVAHFEMMQLRLVKDFALQYDFWENRKNKIRETGEFP